MAEQTELRQSKFSIRLLLQPVFKSPPPKKKKKKEAMGLGQNKESKQTNKKISQLKMGHYN